MSITTRRGSAALLAGLALVLTSLMAVTTSGCELVLGTSNLSDEGTSDGGVVTGDDATGDDDDDDDASVLDAGTDSSTTIVDATSSETGAFDAGEGGHPDGGDGGEGGSEGGVSVNHLSCSNNASAGTCGAALTDNCCADVTITGATFDRSFTDGEDPGDPVSVSTYVLDVYEVTVGRMRAYAAYLGAGGAAPVVGSGKHSHLNGGNGVLVKPAATTTYESGWLASYTDNITMGASASATFAAPPGCTTTYTGLAGDSENLPVNCVSWYDAYAFCIWDGGFLPTEAEWALAATGGDMHDEYDYPWGNTPDEPQDGYATYGCTTVDVADGCPGVVGIDFLGGSVDGVSEMSGNVAEWTLDDYAVSYADTEGCQDCAELKTGAAAKVDRGGAFTDAFDSTYLLTTGRGDITATQHSQLAGFRCARATK